MTSGIKVQLSSCRGCSRCIRACPTEAMRVFDRKVKVIKDLCVDCGECIRKCEDRAIVLNEDNWRLLASQERTVVVADPAFYAQTRGYSCPEELRKRLDEAGLEDITSWTALAFDVTAYAIAKEVDRRGPESLPIISTYCPAVIRLIQINYPELVGRFVPIESPLETAVALWREDTGRTDDVTLVAPCPAKISLVRCPEGRGESHIKYAVSVQKVVRDLLAGGVDVDRPVPPCSKDLRYLQWSLRGGEAKHVASFCDRPIKTISVAGLRNTIDLLRELELGRLEGVDYIECRACDLGCIGGVGNLESRFLTHLRLDHSEVSWSMDPETEREVRRRYDQGTYRLPIAIKARQRIPLDSDLRQAMIRLKEMNQIYADLPHLDCGSCGRPSCRALAEDVVRGNGDPSDCIFKLRERLYELAQEMADLSSRSPHVLK